MAKFKTTVLEFDEQTPFEPIPEMNPNTLLMIVSDGAGKRQFFRLNTSAIEENQTILRNTLDGLCLRLIHGQWVWVPC